MGAYDPRYLQGIEFFNARRFFDAHEVWEELWHEQRGPASHFLQGLIQFATALHHFQRKNLKGTRLLFQSGVALLTPYGERYWGLPVRRLVEEMARCVSGVLPYELKELPGRYHPDKDDFPVELDEQLIPTLTLTPGPGPDDDAEKR